MTRYIAQVLVSICTPKHQKKNYENNIASKEMNQMNETNDFF